MLFRSDQIKDSLGPGYEDLKPEDLNPKTFIKKQLNDALSDEKRKPSLNGKAKLDPDML